MIPTTRIVCMLDDVLPFVFEEGRVLADVQFRMRAMTTITINGERACALFNFIQSITVEDRKKIGGLDMPDGSSFDAWSIHGRFADGDEVWFLWLEMILDKGERIRSIPLDGQRDS